MAFTMLTAISHTSTLAAALSAAAQAAAQAAQAAQAAWAGKSLDLRAIARKAMEVKP